MTRRHPALVALAASTLLAACGPTTHLKLSLRPVSITVPRLVTPAVDLVPAAPVPVAVPLPPPPPILEQLPPVPTEAPSQAPVPIDQPVAPTCPKAGPFDTPAVPAAVLFNSAPVPDTFTQNLFGAYSSSAAKGTFSGTEQITVKELPQTFSSVGQAIDTYSVTMTDASKKYSSVELYRLLHQSPAAAATAPGIYLVGMAWNDPIRGVLSFQPTGDGLFILPSPVAIATNAAQYAGIGTDPNSLTTLTLVRNVTGKKRVDACGTLIDTYTVSMTGVLTTADTQRQVSWTQQLATAYGGLDVESTLTLSDTAHSFLWTRTLRNTGLPKAATK